MHTKGTLQGLLGGGSSLTASPQRSRAFWVRPHSFMSHNVKIHSRTNHTHSHTHTHTGAEGSIKHQTSINSLGSRQIKLGITKIKISYFLECILKCAYFRVKHYQRGIQKNQRRKRGVRSKLLELEFGVVLAVALCVIQRRFRNPVPKQTPSIGDSGSSQYNRKHAPSFGDSGSSYLLE